MDFMEIARARQSCRAYDPDRPVDEALIRSCLEAGRLAPSACNAQPYHVTVAQGPAARQVAEAVHSMGMNKFAQEVPVFLVLSETAYNPTAAVGARLKAQDYRSVDMGIAAAYITAQAAALGLGSCILGWFDEKKLASALGLTQRIRLVISLGYPRQGDPLRPKKRKELSELTTWL